MKTCVLKGVDEVIYWGVCCNGLPVYMLVNKKVNNFYATLNVRYGSVDTEFKVDNKEFIKVNNGIAHFLEHVNFNEKNGHTAHEYFNELGSSINAFTTFDFTSYEVFAYKDFKKNIEHLLDYVQTPVFTEDLVEKEKGIIIEEIKMGKNNPGHKLYYGMNKALFKKDKRKYFVTGEVADVKKITKEELEIVYDTFYHPENMFMVITGNFEPEEAFSIIDKNQKKKKFKKFKMPIRKEYKEPEEVSEKEVTIEANIESPKIKIAYKMPLSTFGNISRDELNIYLSIILRNNFGPTSELNESLFEKNLVTGLGTTRDIFKDVVTIEISVETKYGDKVIPIIKDKLHNLKITEEEIKRRKRVNIACLINDFDDIEYVNTDIAEQLITTNKITDNLYELYNNLDVSIAKQIIERMNLENESIVSLIPFKEEK